MLKAVDKHLLKTALGRAKIKQQVESAQVLAYFQTIVTELWGPKVAQKIKPRYQRNKLLAISTTSSVLAGEIRLHQHLIIKKINQRFGPGTIDQIRTEI